MSMYRKRKKSTWFKGTRCTISKQQRRFASNL